MLALQFGIPVGELTQRMAAAEERMWIAYYQLEPFGSARTDANNALIAQLIYNTNAKKSRPLEDFMLFRKRKTVSRDVVEDARKVFAKARAISERLS